MRENGCVDISSQVSCDSDKRFYSFVTAPTVPLRQKASSTLNSQQCPQLRDLGVIHFVGTSMLFQRNQAILAVTVGLALNTYKTASFFFLSYPICSTGFIFKPTQ